MDFLLDIIVRRIERAQEKKKGRVYQWLQDPGNKEKVILVVEKLLDALDGEETD